MENLEVIPDLKITDNAGLRTKIVRNISEIPFSDWQQVYPDVLEGYHFFRALDESKFEQFSIRYIFVYEDGKPAGAAPCFLMDYSLDTTVQGAFKSFTLFLRKTFPAIFNFKTLMCGSPTSPGRMGIKANAPHVFEAVCEALEHIANEEKVAIMAFKEYEDSYRELFSGLSKRGYHRFDGFPNTSQQLRWKNFDDYLMSLSYPTRYDLKRKFKKVDGKVQIDLEIISSLGDSLDEAYELYRQMLLKHKTIFEVLPKEFFVQISEQMPKETKFFLWRIHGKLVAFAFGLASKDYFLDCHLGLDYSVAYDYHLYFVRFRDIMSWCLKNGIRTYEMGCTNYDPKKRLGFSFIPLDIYAKHRNRFVNSLLKMVCPFLEPKHSDPFLKQLNKPKKSKETLTWGIFSMIVMVDAIDSFAQVLMKRGLPKGAELFQAHGIGNFLSQSAASGTVLAGILLYASNFFLWILVLSRLDLSVAIVLASTNYIVLPLVSILVLHEKISLLRWTGVFFIMLGVYFVSRSPGEDRS